MAGFLVDNPIYSEKEPLSEIFRQRLGHRTGVPTPARPRFEIDPSQGLRKTLSADRGNQTHPHCLGSQVKKDLFVITTPFFVPEFPIFPKLNIDSARPAYRAKSIFSFGKMGNSGTKNGVVMTKRSFLTCEPRQ